MKKKIFTTALAIALIVLSIAGTSLAYFTDVEEATNVFTSGNVDIKLTYGGEVADKDAGTTFEEISTKVYPGQSYQYEATITNKGSEEAYVGAVITLTGANIGYLISLDGDSTDNIPLKLQNLFTDFAAGATVTCQENNGSFTVFVLVPEIQAANATVEIFDSIQIPKEWDHDQMDIFKNAKITVKAYATQTVGFGNAADALQAAFPDVW